MKTLNISDFKLTPEETKTIVSGAQKFLPPADEDGEPISGEYPTLTPDDKPPS